MLIFCCHVTVHRVYHIYSANELFTMICQGNNWFCTSSPRFQKWIIWFKLMCDNLYGYLLFTPDTHVVLVTCPAVVGVEKVNVLNSALVRRYITFFYVFCFILKGVSEYLLCWYLCHIICIFGAYFSWRFTCTLSFISSGCLLFWKFSGLNSISVTRWI